MKFDIPLISPLEKLIVFCLYMFLFLGIGIDIGSPEVFTEQYAQEDGLIENLTAIFLFGAALLVIRFIWKHKGINRFKTWCHILLVVLLLFGAGEEISWGQRIFNIETPEFFLEHNAQQETNLHNLMVGDTKINKLIFGLILSTFLFIYFIGFPILYSKVSFFNKLFDKFGIPIPHIWQSFVFVSATLMTMVITSSRKWELSEMVLSFCIMLVILNSYNNMGYSKEELQS